MADKSGMAEINEILLNIMPNSWSKQVYVQGFDWDSIVFLKAVNMFERMDIFKGVVEPYYKKTT